MSRLKQERIAPFRGKLWLTRQGISLSHVDQAGPDRMVSPCMSPCSSDHLIVQNTGRSTYGL